MEHSHQNQEKSQHNLNHHSTTTYSPQTQKSPNCQSPQPQYNHPPYNNLSLHKQPIFLQNPYNLQRNQTNIPLHQEETQTIQQKENPITQDNLLDKELTLQLNLEWKLNGVTLLKKDMEKIKNLQNIIEEKNRRLAISLKGNICIIGPNNQNCSHPTLNHSFAYQKSFYLMEHPSDNISYKWPMNITSYMQDPPIQQDI